jgi:hypothetical protein
MKFLQWFLVSVNSKYIPVIKGDTIFEENKSRNPHRIGNISNED